MLKRIFLWIGTVCIAAFIIFTAEAVLSQKTLADKTLRLHIVANSDTPRDQEQKIRLRDHILGEIRDMALGCSDLESAERTIRRALPRLRESVKDFLAKDGSHYDVSVTLCRETFDTRQYDTFSLPAGEYHALRIVIGEGMGKNWWCVVFPTLCNATDPEELERMAEKGGYDEGDLAFIRREETKYKLRFKVLEWFGMVFN